MPRRLPLFCGLLALALPAAAQQQEREQERGSARATASDPNPAGGYAGVEPGEAQPPPAYERLVRRQQRRRSVILTWPGFAPLPGGGSRFFVQTTEPRVAQMRIERGRIVVSFPNTATHLTNSRRWLETRFFDTPVLRARLERRGRDMALVLHLREGVTATPTIRTEAAPGDDFHYVYIDFPPVEHAPRGSNGRPDEARSH